LAEHNVDDAHARDGEVRERRVQAHELALLLVGYQRREEAASDRRVPAVHEADRVAQQLDQQLDVGHDRNVDGGRLHHEDDVVERERQQARHVRRHEALVRHADHDAAHHGDLVVEINVHDVVERCVVQVDEQRANVDGDHGAARREEQIRDQEQPALAVLEVRVRPCKGLPQARSHRSNDANESLPSTLVESAVGIRR